MDKGLEQTGRVIPLGGGEGSVEQTKTRKLEEKKKKLKNLSARFRGEGGARVKKN